VSTGSQAEVLGPDRRERRKAETRRRLLDAARQLFVRQGYHATRPADIAATADLAHGTFYLHFADKREAFLAFVDEATREIQTATRARLRGVHGFEPRLRASLDAILDYSAAHPGVLRTAFADAAILAPEGPALPSLRDRLAELLAAALRDGMERGELRADYDPHLTAYGIVGFVQQSIARFAATGVGDRQALLDNVIRFCGRALLRAGERETSNMTQLVYTEEELMREPAYAAPYVVAGQRIHGGLDSDGRYVSPRTAVRPRALEAWRAALRARGGEPLPADDSLLAGVRYPNAEQQKLLLRSGLGQTFWNTLTITGIIEARGRLLAEAPFPELSGLVVEDVREWAIGHLNRGLLKAHGIDEGGEPERGIGGHDVMWFALRDLAFGETRFPTPEVPTNIGRPDGTRRLAPEIEARFEAVITFLCNLLMIEFRAENGFRFSQEVLRDASLWGPRAAQAREAAEIVGHIRQDEKIHVDSLLLYLGELRSATFRTVDGGSVPGREIVDRIWSVIVHWATQEQPKLALEQQRPIMEKRIAAHPDAARVQAGFDALAG
jgi:AcrR family transcriptional regulator